MLSDETIADLLTWAKEYQIDDILQIYQNKSFHKIKEDLLNLKCLDLSHKGLTYLPQSLFELESIEKLNLSHNHLQKLPLEIKKFQALQILNISWNHIEESIDFLSTNIKVNKSWNRK